MAKIELKSRPIKIFRALEKYRLAPHHLYILYTPNAGNRIVISGGPERDYGIGYLFDDIKVTSNVYEDGEPNFEKEGLPHPSVILAEGESAEILSIFNKIWSKAKEINRAGFDYKISGLPGDWQNSNTVAKELIAAAGLEFQLPRYEKGREVWVPSYKSNLDHSAIDKTGIGNELRKFFEMDNIINKLEDKIKEILATGIAIIQLKECIEEELAYQKEASEMTDDPTAMLARLFEYFDTIDLDNSKMSNPDRFRNLEQKARKKGDHMAKIFGNLATQLELVQSLFGTIKTPEYENTQSNNDLKSILTELQDSVIELGRAFDICSQELLC